jgi:hypothetical protein
VLTRRALPEWIPAGDLNSPVSITEAADRHLSLPGMDLAMGVEPIQRRYECRMLPSTSRQKKQNLEPCAEVESAYPIYKTGASPSMLAGHGHACRACLVRGTGLEPVSEDWQPSILAARRTQHKNGAGGENRTPLASLESWNSANKPLPRLCIYKTVKELYFFERQLVGDLRIERSIFCAQDRRIPNFPVPVKMSP